MVAVFGGGGMGNGWAARFLRIGWDVRVFELDPDTEREIGEGFHNVRGALSGQSDVAYRLRASWAFTFHYMPSGNDLCSDGGACASPSEPLNRAASSGSSRYVCADWNCAKQTATARRGSFVREYR